MYFDWNQKSWVKLRSSYYLIIMDYVETYNLFALYHHELWPDPFHEQDYEEEKWLNKKKFLIVLNKTCK